MGGALAIHLASLDPPEKMVLVAPFSRLPGVWSQLLPLIGPFVKFWKPFRTTDFDDPRVRKNVEEIFPGLPIDNPEVQNILRKEVNLPVKSILEVVKLGRKAYRLAPQINVPTLVIQGVKDVTVEPGQTLKLTNRFQKANVLYRTYPGGHDLLKDSPELLNQITQDILTFIGQPSTGKFLDS
jgi:pimeloyl-ACP methyl ester carboxylesterase